MTDKLMEAILSDPRLDLLGREARVALQLQRISEMETKTEEEQQDYIDEVNKILNPPPPVPYRLTWLDIIKNKLKK